MNSPGPIQPQVRFRARLARERVSGAEKQLKILREIVIAAGVRKSRRTVQRRVWPLAEDFHAQRQFFSQIALHQPSAERITERAGRVVDCVARASVRRPRPAAFLNPERQSSPELSISQAEV